MFLPLITLASIKTCHLVDGDSTLLVAHRTEMLSLLNKGDVQYVVCKWRPERRQIRIKVVDKFAREPAMCRSVSRNRSALFKGTRVDISAVCDIRMLYPIRY